MSVHWGIPWTLKRNQKDCRWRELKAQLSIRRAGILKYFVTTKVLTRLSHVRFLSQTSFQIYFHLCVCVYLAVCMPHINKYPWGPEECVIELIEDVCHGLRLSGSLREGRQQAVSRIRFSLSMDHKGEDVKSGHWLDVPKKGRFQHWSILPVGFIV